MTDRPASEEYAEAFRIAMSQMMDAGISSLKSGSKIAEISRMDVEIAETPASVVWQSDKVTVSRYDPVTKPIGAPPVLITYGLFGRQTMIDLQEDRSMVRNLLAAGLDVYVLDWGSPTRADQFLTMDDLVLGYLADACAYLGGEYGGPITLFGICEGGTFSACLAALEPQLIKGLPLAITPIDFAGDPDNYWAGEGFLNQWIGAMDQGEIEGLIDLYGNMPGAFSGAMFSALTPMNSMTKYTMGLKNLQGDDSKMLNFLRMEKWIADRPDHPGAAAKQWFGELYRENKLVRGTFKLDGRIVDLKHIKAPVLNIYALHDHIVPVSTTKPLGKFIPKSRYQEIGFPGGHVGVFVSSKAQGVVAGGVVDWIKKTQM